MKRIVVCLACIAFSLYAYAGKITGTVTDTNGAALGFASITVVGTTKGVVANSQGVYSIELAAGSYTLVCHYVGYKAGEKKVLVAAQNQVVDFQLAVQELTMDEIVVQKGEDPAIAIMQQTIARREFYKKQVDSFTVDVYIKGLLRSRGMPDKFFGQKIDKKEMGNAGIDSTGSGILFLSESLTKVSFTQPDKVKYEVVSSRESGGGYGLSFPFFIDFYTNNVSVFSNNLNPRGFVSPIADNAFHYYKFKYEGNFFEGDKMIDRIKVTPRRKHEPLFSGYLQIVDGEWRIHSLELTTTSDYQLELIDTLKITQMHAAVTADIWRTQNQVVYVAVKKFGFDMAGNFLNVYNNYNLDPGFGKKHFDRILMSYDTAFNKKDTGYWTAIRPVPLEPDEKRDFVLKDSVSKVYRDSMYTKRNIDSLRKQQRPVKFTQFFRGGITRNYYSSNSFTTYKLEPLLGGLEYNTVEGLAINVNQSIEVWPRRSGSNFELQAAMRYGLSNEHFNSFLKFTITPKADGFRNRFLQFAGGKTVAQINGDHPIDALTNSLYTLLAKRNYMKIYEAWFGSVSYGTGFESGLRLGVGATYQDRIPLENTTDFSFFKKDRQILPNHPYELAAIPFNAHQALVTSLTLTYQPGQRYIQFPNRKVTIGSKYPTFELQYAKGINRLLASDVDFDKWKLSMFDDMNFKLGGTFKYRVSVGGFLNDNSVGLPDYQHFNGNQTFYNFKYLNSFQLAPYYQYSHIEKLYAVAHVEHHLNGLLTNKIPLFNRLKWNLVVGSNTFYVNTDNYYVEAFAGLENILKIFRVDFVTAYQSQPGSHFGVRIGPGGLIGGKVQFNQR